MSSHSATDTGKRESPLSNCRLLFLGVILSMLLGIVSHSVYGQSIYTVTAPAGDGTSTSLRAPSGLKEHAYHRTALLIGASELSLIPSGMKITRFGFVVVEGAGMKVSGTLRLYLANSTEQTAVLQPYWDVVVPGMRMVYDGPFTVPDTAGTIDCGLTEPFTYLGHGLTVAYEFHSPGPYTTRNAVFAANTAMPSSSRSAFSETAAPEILSDVSDFRPALRFGFPFPSFRWTSIASGTHQQLWSLDVVGDSTAWACSSTGGVFRTTNRGSTWLPAGKLLVPTTAIVGLSGRTAFVATSSDSGPGGIFRTRDGGVAWSRVYDAGPSVVKILDNLSTSNVWGVVDGVGDTVFILSSFDGGESWVKLSNPIQVPLGLRVSRATYCRLGPTLWFGTSAPSGEGGRVYRSVSGPDGPWSFSTTGRGNVCALAFSSPNGAGLVAHSGCRDTIQQTSDGGLTWRDRAVSGLGQVLALEHFPGGTDAWAATSTGIWHTTDNGMVWEQSIPAPADTIYALRFFGNYQAALAVGGNGVVIRGTWAVNPVLAVTAGDRPPSGYVLTQNFPNPFNSSTNIEFSVPESQFVSLKVVDVLGREVAVLTDEIRPAGTHTISWDASGLASGIYFYSLRVGSFHETKKSVLLR